MTHPLEREGPVGDRWRSILEQLGRGSLELFNRLTPAAREYFRRGVERRLQGIGDTATLEALYALDYDRIPPGPEKFLTHADYCKHVGDDLWPAWHAHFKRVCAPANRIYEVDLTGAMGLGKDIWVETRVATPMGWRLAKDICPGDELIGTDGRPTRVLGVFPQGMRDMYRVTFSDGRTARVDGDHLWAVRTPADKHRGRGFRVFSTTDLISEGLRDGAGNRRWQIPMCKPVHYPTRKLPLDPYVLGVWLGDGSKGCPNYTPELVGAALPEGVIHKRHADRRRSSSDFWSMTTPRGRPNVVRDALRVLGLLNLGSHERFIPNDYLTAGVEQRVALLNGLMDTDGELWATGTVQYSSSSRRMADGVAELIESLGGVARRTTKRAPKYTYRGERRVGRDSYRVNVSLPACISPFRARAGYSPNTKYLPCRSIDSIEPDGRGEGVCFKVDAEDSLFLIDHYIATHNTWFAMFVLAYKIARIGHLRDPARFYGLAPGSKIVFGLYALTKDLVKEVGFYDLRDMIIDQSPFFRDVMRRSPYGKEKIEWSDKKVEVITGSTALHAIGKNLFAVVADELNYYNQGEKTAMKARDLVSEVSRRLESRFMDSAGDIPGVAIYISQTRTTSDFLELRVRDAQRRQLKGVHVVRGAKWEFCPKGYERMADRARSEPETLGPHYADTAVGKVPAFRIYVGDEVSDARVLDRAIQRDDGSWLVEPVDLDAAVPDGRLIHVPVIHYRAFDDDLHGALRAIADEPTGSFTPFFSRKEVIEGAFDESLPFPFRAQTIPCYEQQSQELREFFDHELVTRVYMGKRVPIRNPDAPRYVHFDLSQGRGDGRDLTGFAILHPSAHYQTDRRNADEDPAQVGDIELCMDLEVDFYVALTGGPYGQPIDYARARRFISFLASIGYWIRFSTSDQYMAADHAMRLRDAGFNTETISTDRTSKPYRTLRQVFNERRISIPFPPNFTPSRWGSRKEALEKLVLYNELAGLEHDVRRDKVDHRDQNPDGSRGSKDVADGLAGAAFKCLTDDVSPGQNPNKPSHQSRVRDNLNRYMRVAPF